MCLSCYLSFYVTFYFPEDALTGETCSNTSKIQYYFIPVKLKKLSTSPNFILPNYNKKEEISPVNS